MIRLKIILVLSLALSFSIAFSQVGVGTTSPDASSVLDVTAIDKGILIPRISLTDVIETMLDGTNIAATGLLIFNTNPAVTGGNGVGYYYFDGTQWVKLLTGSTTIEKIDDLLDGKSDNDGTQNGSSIFLGINAGLNDDSSDNRNIGIGFGAFQSSINGYNNSAIGYQSLNSNSTGSGNVAIGYQTLSNNTIGNWNVANGHLALYSNIGGNNNTANGNESLYSNINGYNNTASGYESMFTNSNGYDNTANGLQSLYSNTTGNNNVAFGVRSMYLNTEGIANTANGSRSLYSNITGNFNTAIGNHALYSNTIGNFNTALGYEAMISNTQGINNVANGSRSLYSNTSGSDNVANGFRALYRNVDGLQNSAIGSFSQFFNVSGSHNLAIGYQSLLFNASGSYNIGIGSNTGASNSAGSNNIYLGHSAGTPETGSNKLYIENSGANANNALIYGEFDTNILRTNSEFQIGNPSGTGYAFPTVDGTANQIMQTNGSGTLSWIDSSSLSSEDHDFYMEGTLNAPNSINDDIYTQGNVAIGKATANYALDIFENEGTRAINARLLTADNAVTSVFHIENSNSGTFAKNGVYIEYNGSANGSKNGVYNRFINSGNGNQTGVYNFLESTSNANQAGIQNTIQNTGNGIHYGVISELNGTGNGRKYGVYNSISSSAGGIHYGVYSQVLKSSGFAGYFLGRVAIGTTSANRYIFPNSRGSDGQIMQTNATGQLSWVTPNQGDITSVIAGDGLTGGATTGDVTLDVNASNGLTVNTSDVVLGGALTQITTLNHGTNDLIFNLNSTGSFVVQDGGTNHFEVRDSGLTYFGDDTYWNDGSTTGTTIARLYDSGNDGVFEIYKDALVQHQFHSAGTSVINELGQDFDFRIEGNNEQNLLYVDAGTDRLGIMENSPSFDVHLKQSSNTQGGAGGLGFESSSNTNNWKMYHSGTHFSFAENGVRRGYIEAGTGNYIPTSDRRLKKNITEVEDVLSKVNQLKTYHYVYKDQDASAKKTIGFMAQDIQPLFPELVSQADDGYYGLNYSGFGVVAIKAIQEQQKLIDAQKQQIKALEESQKDTNSKIDNLLQRIEKLENQD